MGKQLDQLDKLKADWDRIKHICLTNAKNAVENKPFMGRAFGCQTDYVSDLFRIITGKPFGVKPFTFISSGGDDYLFLHYEDSSDKFGFGSDFDDREEFDTSSGDCVAPLKDVETYLSEVDLDYIVAICGFYNEHKEFIEREFKKESPTKDVPLKQRIKNFNDYIDEHEYSLDYDAQFREIGERIFKLLALKTPPAPSKRKPMSKESVDATVNRWITEVDNSGSHHISRTTLRTMFQNTADFSGIAPLSSYHEDIVGIISIFANELSDQTRFFPVAIKYLSELHPNLKSLRNAAKCYGFVPVRNQLVVFNKELYICSHKECVENNSRRVGFSKSVSDNWFMRPTAREVCDFVKANREFVASRTN